jgi:HK97 family phage portal protein
MVDSQYNVLYYVCRKWSAVFEVKPDDMFHFVLTYDVKDIVYWISDLSWVVYEVYSDNEAWITNYYAMLNNNVPAWLYILKEWVDDAKAKQILNDVKREVKWSKNRNKSIVSNAIQDFKSMAQSNTDMDFVELRKFNSEKICSALWVPKTILSYTEWINYSNWENQYTKYIENTIRPLEMEINYIFSAILSEIIPNVYFEIIDNHINDKKEKWEFAEKMIKNWLRTRNEAREYIWETEITDNDLMDKFTVWNDVKLIEDLEFSITDPAISNNTDLWTNKKSL